MFNAESCLCLQLEPVGRVLNVNRPGHRILLCTIMVNVVRLLSLWVKRSPAIYGRVPIHKPIARPHGTMVTLTGTSAIKEIHNSDLFYATYQHSFEAIQVTLSRHWLVTVAKVLS